jgi:hypothetical protein
LNTIPEGYSNNLWNIALYLVAADVRFINYRLPMISDEMVEKYKKKNKPEDIATQAEVDEITNLYGNHQSD